MKWWLAIFLMGALALWLSRGRRLLLGLAVLVMAVPFAWPVVYLFLEVDASERAERLLGMWPLLLIISFVMVVFTARRRKGIELVLPLIVLGTVHGAFLSQQLWGSTYALWPFFMILLAAVIRGLTEVMMIRSKQFQDNDQPATSELLWPISFALVLSLSLIISGTFYLRSHERLDYANLDDGELARSKLPALKGVVMRGSWIPDFEELVAYSEKEIPRDDGILCLPGEDLFYYTTGRHPQFPVLLFDHTVNPYSPVEIVDLARLRSIQWLIVKDELQMEEEPLERKDELMKLLLEDFESVESLDNYEIYKRKAPDSEEHTESNDNSDDSKKP